MQRNQGDRDRAEAARRVRGSPSALARVLDADADGREDAQLAVDRWHVRVVRSWCGGCGALSGGLCGAGALSTALPG